MVSGQISVLPAEAWVRSLVKELDPTYHEVRKKKEKEPNRDGRKGRDTVQLRPIPVCEEPKKSMIFIIAGILPR